MKTKLKIGFEELLREAERRQAEGETTIDVADLYR